MWALASPAGWDHPRVVPFWPLGWFFLAHFQADQLLTVFDNYFIKDTQITAALIMSGLPEI